MTCPVNHYAAANPPSRIIRLQPVLHQSRELQSTLPATGTTRQRGEGGAVADRTGDIPGFRTGK